MTSSENDQGENWQNQKTMLKFGSGCNQLAHSFLCYFPFTCDFQSVHALLSVLLRFHHVQFIMRTSYSPSKWTNSKQQIKQNKFVHNGSSSGVELKLGRAKGAQYRQCSSNTIPFWLASISRHLHFIIGHKLM